jgi:hypothetical protein
MHTRHTKTHLGGCHIVLAADQALAIHVRRRLLLLLLLLLPAAALAVAAASSSAATASCRGCRGCQRSAARGGLPPAARGPAPGRASSSSVIIEPTHASLGQLGSRL